MNDAHRYDAILDLPHYVSETHPRMTNGERAAQFSPFAALTGYDDAVRETARRTEGRRTLAEEEKAAIDRKLRQVKAALEAGNRPKITVTYFLPDGRKAGGAYLCVRGEVKGLDLWERALLLRDGRQIPIESILGMETDQQEVE